MIKALIYLSIILITIVIFYLSNKIKKKSLFFSISILILVLMIFSVATIFIKNDKSEKFYNPPRFDGEKVIPGYFDEKDS